MQQSELGKRQWVSSNTWRLLLDENLPKSLWKSLRADSTPVAEVVREVLNAMATLKEQDLTNKVFVVETGQVRLVP